MLRLAFFSLSDAGERAEKTIDLVLPFVTNNSCK